MPAKPETLLQRKIKAALEQKFGGYWVKIHGGPFQPAGLPDLVGVVRGQLIGIEVKRPETRADLTPRQDAMLRKLREAGAVTGVATSVAEALELVEHGLAVEEIK